MCVYIIVFLDTMGLCPNHDKIEALRTRLSNEPMYSKASSSMEELNVRLNKGVKLSCTRLTSRKLLLV